MGRDKALIELGGRTLLERTVDVLGELTSEVLLACGDRERYPQLPLRRALDREPGRGPLEGLAAALETASTPWVLIAACDLPHLEPADLAPLLEAAGEADVVLPMDRERRQPLVALYSRRVQPAVEAALSAGRRRMVDFWDEELPSGEPVRVHHVRHDGDERSFWNVNTPADLARASERTGA